jgi:hypothetical protein
MASDEFTFRELSDDDQQYFVSLREFIANIVQARYGAAGLTSTQADLAPLQRLLDDRVFSPSQVDEFEALGLVFGDVLAHDLGMRWVVVSGPYGTYPVLRYQNTGIQISALSMIAKRVQDGTEVQLSYLFGQLVPQIQKMIDSGEY